MDINISTKHLLRKMLSKKDVKSYPILRYDVNPPYVEQCCKLLKDILNSGEDDFVFRTYAHQISYSQLTRLLQLKQMGKDFTRCCNYGKLRTDYVNNYLDHLESGIPNTRWLYEVGCKLTKWEIESYKEHREKVGEILDKAIAKEGYSMHATDIYIYFANRMNVESEFMLETLLRLFNNDVRVNSYLWVIFDIELPDTPEHFVQRLEWYLSHKVKLGTYNEIFTEELVYLCRLIEEYNNLLDWDICTYFITHVRTNLRNRKLEDYSMKLIEIIERLLDSSIKVTQSMVETLSSTLAPLLRDTRYPHIFNTNPTIDVYFHLGLTREEVFHTFTVLLTEVKVTRLKETWLDRLEAYDEKFL